MFYFSNSYYKRDATPVIAIYFDDVTIYKEVKAHYNKMTFYGNYK
jgi:hypothetical protein